MNPNKNRRSGCPVACTLDILGDKWTLLIVRDLLHGATQFDELRNAPEGIARNILSHRLRQLTDMGMVKREPDISDKRRFNYRLTERGESLRPILQSIAQWGLQNIDNTETLSDDSVNRSHE
ncbi:MAG: helix-turn-helix domain-containing protein [Verrucomicrobiota bacterium]